MNKQKSHFGVEKQYRVQSKGRKYFNFTLNLLNLKKYFNLGCPILREKADSSEVIETLRAEREM